MPSTNDTKATILVVDDDSATCLALSRALAMDGYEVTVADSAEAGLKTLKNAKLQLIITDVVMGGMSGIGLLEHVRRDYPELPVVVCTGYGTIASAVEAMHKGATDYLTKPIDLDKLALTVKRALVTSALLEDNRALRRQLLQRHSYKGITGRSPVMQSLFSQLESIATTDVTVLIRGESGTGKELIARAIHQLSPRSAASMRTVDCAAISESLIESELFGHEKGAFTGAAARKIGKLELADGGTLFLDEVGELTPMAQTKLLRVIQEQTFERVGGTKAINVDARLITATNRDLEAMLDDGSFREDFYYRLNVVSLEVPPLRDRVEDIELLARGFLREFARTHQRKEPVLHRTAVSALASHRWPGNVRELKNLCEKLVVTEMSGVVTAGSLPFAAERTQPKSQPTLLDGAHPLAEIERQVIFQTLARTDGNKAEAAKILGIGLKTLYRRLADYDAG